MNGFAPEIRMAKLEGISQVLPYDYPLTVTTFWYVTGWLSDALWDLCGGDMTALKGLLDVRHGCVRLTELERSTTGLAFEDEWGRATWAAWQRWCSAQGLADPYIEIIGAL